MAWTTCRSPLDPDRLAVQLRVELVEEECVEERGNWFSRRSPSRRSGSASSSKDQRRRKTLQPFGNHLVDLLILKHVRIRRGNDELPVLRRDLRRMPLHLVKHDHWVLEVVTVLPPSMENLGAGFAPTTSGLR